MKQQQWVAVLQIRSFTEYRMKKKTPLTLGQTKYPAGLVSCLRVVSCQCLRKEHTKHASTKVLSQPAVNASFSYLGQAQFTHSGTVSKGEAPFPVKVVTLGSTTGKSS